MSDESRRATWGRIGGLTAQARHGGRAMTAPARRAFEAKWERLVDPEGRLDPQERTERAARLMRAPSDHVADPGGRTMCSRHGHAESSTAGRPTVNPVLCVRRSEIERVLTAVCDAYENAVWASDIGELDFELVDGLPDVIANLRALLRDTNGMGPCDA
ncbi:MAG TPA: hypothetical protein VF802_05360 [Candidatus Limnocylindrales bacterium]